MLIGTTRPAVTGWENGWTSPMEDNFNALAEALGVSPEMLSGRVPIEPKIPAQEDTGRRGQAETGEPVRRRTRTERKQETGATSGFIAYAEMRGMPEFLYEVIADMHIRRMLFLCGQHDKVMLVKKTMTPNGIEWSISA